MSDDELKDQLRKLGLRVRPRTVEKSLDPKAGKIGFDDRGNAVFEWNNDQLTEEGETGDRLRKRALDYQGLALVDDEPPKDAPIQPNPKGLRVGYNPYESGMLPKKGAKKKTDLHELSRWIEAKRKLEKKRGEE